MQIDTNKDTINEANVGIQIQKLIFILYSIFLCIYLLRETYLAHITLFCTCMEPYINFTCNRTLAKIGHV